MINASIVLVTYCPNQVRYDFCERSFSEIHRTGVPRDKYELIVVNNGGIHGDLIAALDADMVISMDRNVGQAAGLNIGISVSQSINLALMDDDLSYKEGWLQAGLDVLYHYPKHVVSLRAVKKGYVTGVAGRGNKYARKVGGCWILRRELFEKVGRFGMYYFDFGGLWTRNLIRYGSRFVVSKTPYIFHLGGGKSMGSTPYRFFRWLDHPGKSIG